MKTLILAAATLAALNSLAAHADSPSSDTTRTHAECASLFMTLDKDGDGRISRSEASADPAIASAFEELRLGESGYMSVNEFMEACQKPGARMHHTK